MPVAVCVLQSTWAGLPSQVLIDAMLPEQIPLEYSRRVQAQNCLLDRLSVPFLSHGT